MVRFRFEEKRRPISVWIHKIFDFHIDIAEALALGLDAAVIAGTGSDETLAERARFFCFTEKLKILTVVVNHETWSARDGVIRAVRLKCSLYAFKLTRTARRV